MQVQQRALRRIDAEPIVDSASFIAPQDFGGAFTINSTAIPANSYSGQSLYAATSR